MAGEESIPALRPVVGLPIALYDSNGLLFEIYEGDQPCRSHRMGVGRIEND